MCVPPRQISFSSYSLTRLIRTLKSTHSNKMTSFNHPERDDSSSETTRTDARYGSIVRTPTQLPFNEDLVNLPSRTLSNEAYLEEYTQETIDGQILQEVKSNATGVIERYELVTWKIGDPENPKNFSKAYKWYCTMVVAVTCFVVAFNSAVITADLEGVAKEFHVSMEVALLSITVFVVGFGVGTSPIVHLREIRTNMDL